MQTRIWGLLEWLLHHWKAVKNNKIKKACVTVSLCGLQTWNIYTLVHHRKNIFALESTVSVLEGSLRTVVYHGHSAALLEVKVKVWEWQRSQGWCYRCVLWQPARAEVLTLWCAASWGPFSGFVRPKLFCDNSAAPLSSLTLSIPKLIHADCTKAVVEAPGPTKAVAPRWSSLLCIQNKNEGRFHLMMSLIKQCQLITFQPLATWHLISHAVKWKLYLKHSRKSTHVVWVVSFMLVTFFMEMPFSFKV